MENNENFKEENTKTNNRLVLVLLFIIIVLIIAITAIILNKKMETANNSNENENIVENSELEETTEPEDTFDYEGTWYLNENAIDQETLKLNKQEDGTYKMNIFFYRIAAMQDTTVEIENNSGTFTELTEDGNYSIDGTINLNDGKIEIEILTSSVDYIASGKKYVFEYKSN